MRGSSRTRNQNPIPKYDETGLAGRSNEYFRCWPDSLLDGQLGGRVDRRWPEGEGVRYLPRPFPLILLDLVFHHSLAEKKQLQTSMRRFVDVELSECRSRFNLKACIDLGSKQNERFRKRQLRSVFAFCRLPAVMRFTTVVAWQSCNQRAPYRISFETWMFLSKWRYRAFYNELLCQASSNVAIHWVSNWTAHSALQLNRTAAKCIPGDLLPDAKFKTECYLDEAQRFKWAQTTRTRTRSISRRSEKCCSEFMTTTSPTLELSGSSFLYISFIFMLVRTVLGQTTATANVLFRVNWALN